MSRRWFKRLFFGGVLLLALLFLGALAILYLPVPEPFAQFRGSIANVFEPITRQLPPYQQPRAFSPTQPSIPPAQPFATQPTAAGPVTFQAYFTTPKYPDRVSDHHGSLDDPLTAFIHFARSSVDMAIYQLDLPNVTQALLDAKKRGVVVRVVTHTDILNDPKENASFKKLEQAGIVVVGGNPSALMHNKFVVVDRSAVWTGSWNFTVNDTYRYNNNGVLIQSPELARNYIVTFEKMFIDKQFGGSRKAGGTTPRLTIGGVAVENYFAPEDKVADKIVARLKAAQKTIHFLAFSFTDNKIGDIVLDRWKSGLKIAGIFERTGSQSKFSEYSRFKAAGLDVHEDLKSETNVTQDGNPYLMHHKVFIIDDKTVILGSFNFTASANEDNDENLMIVDDASLAQAFEAEFARVYEQAMNPPPKK